MFIIDKLISLVISLCLELKSTIKKDQRYYLLFDTNSSKTSEVKMIFFRLIDIVLLKLKDLYVRKDYVLFE